MTRMRISVLALLGALLIGVLWAGVSLSAPSSMLALNNLSSTPRPSPVASPAGFGQTPVSAEGNDELLSTFQASSDEQALADKFAPIAMVKKQSAPCDTNGEPYLPVPVEVVLGAPDVALKRNKRRAELEDPIVKMGPLAADLVKTDSGYYLDLPGNPLNPGCDYEQWARQRMKDLNLQPSVYAHIATQPSEPGFLALQYYFYWPFDDFTNTHESDWEMIQLTFAAESPEQALNQEPIQVAFAQHAGGETANWDDPKLEKIDGTHIVTYPAAGSHADYYSSAIWLGWGANGTGFGCDKADAPLEQVDLKAVVVPQEIDPDGPFAWTLFQGRWGERQTWEYNGPLSPNVAKRWVEPISWTTGLRDRSLPIPSQQTLGMGPSSFFCSLSDVGGSVMKIVPEHPQLVAGIVITLLLGLLLLSFLSWQYFRRAFWLYFNYFWVFLLSSLLLLPVAGIATWIQSRIEDASITIGGTNLTADASGATGLSVGLILQVFLVTLIAPSVIWATARLVRGERANFFSAVVETMPRVPRIAGATIWNGLILLLLTLTILGIPWALYRAVQWSFSAHAVILDDADVRTARHESRNVIKGDWLRTVSMAILVVYVAGIPGPLIGMILLLTNVVSIRTAGSVSSLVFAIMYPITIIASTLYYLRRREQKAQRRALGLPGDSPGQGFWLRVRHPKSWRERIVDEPEVPVSPIPNAVRKDGVRSERPLPLISS